MESPQNTRMSDVITVTLPRGTTKVCPIGTLASEALQVITTIWTPTYSQPKSMACAWIWTLHFIKNASLEPVRFSSPEGKEIYRHSSTHIMAQAVKEIFPSANLTIGPPIEGGFYYDFSFERPFTPEDLERIEQKAHEIIQADLPIKRMEMSKTKPSNTFSKKGKPLRLKSFNKSKTRLSLSISKVSLSIYAEALMLDRPVGLKPSRFNPAPAPIGGEMNAIRCFSAFMGRHSPPNLTFKLIWPDSKRSNGVITEN